MKPALLVLAQAFAVARFEPAERGARFFVVDALDWQGPAAFGSTVDYAFKPLVVRDENGGERAALVRHQLVVHAGGAVVLAERLRLALDVPVLPYQDGDDALVRGQPLSGAAGAAFGDPRLAVDALAWKGERISLALGVRGHLPLGTRSRYASDGSVRVAPQAIVAGRAGIFVWSTRAGIHVRPNQGTFGSESLGSEIVFAAGGGIEVGRVAFGPEMFGAARTTGGAAAIEALAGAHVDLGSGVRVAVGGGTGLTRGLGAPRARVVASFEWTVPVPIPDRDKDQIPDAEDACPDRAGAKSGDPEANGCPAPAPLEREDLDGDSITDVDDACPTLPGPRTSDPRTNGCPTLAMVTDTEIRIEHEIRFATGSADLVAPSDEVLGAVQRLLDEHAEITKVRVEGHTDDTGDDTFNDDLSARRAMSVVRWLTEHGVAPRRLESSGFGRRKPIDTNQTDEGRAKNRRVVFTIVERR